MKKLLVISFVLVLGFSGCQHRIVTPDTEIVSGVMVEMTEDMFKER